MTFDVHAHCLPGGLLATLRADPDRYGIEITSDNRAVIAGRTTMPLRDDFTDTDARLKAMDEAGVTVQLLSSWVDVTGYELSADQGARYARMFNEGLATTVAAHPDRFAGLGTVPLQAPVKAAEELRYAVTTLGFAGVEIATEVNGAELDEPDLEPFWAAANDLQCLVLIHPFASGRSGNRYFLNNLVLNPAQTTTAAAHLVFGGVLERHPDLVVCLVHGGGFLPYQRGRLERGYAAKAELTATRIAQPPSAYLRRLYYDTVTHDPEALRFLLDWVGPEQVVLGSDYPFEMGDPDPVATVEAVEGLDAEARERILRGNVARILDGIRR